MKCSEGEMPREKNLAANLTLRTKTRQQRWSQEKKKRPAEANKVKAAIR
jgi:hypothetical protein